jgi:ribosomal protein S18 acetylase RimI-like enzyme
LFQADQESHVALRSAVAAEAASGAQRANLPLDGLFVIPRRGGLAGVAWAYPTPGRTAVVWPPQLRPGEPASSAARLLASVDLFLRRQSVQLGQATPLPAQRDQIAWLTAEGYLPAAEILFLACPADQFPEAPPRTELTFQPYLPADRNRLERLLKQTYRHSQDCPQLHKLRDVRDVVDGYQQATGANSANWFFLRHEGRDAGCLLLADHPDQDALEIMYLGLIPQARGCGWGFQATRQALWLARCAGRQRVSLAVDAHNQAALGVYVAAGFQGWDRRSLLVKTFS